MIQQNIQILHHLKTGKSITPLEALMSYSCLRLAARIHEMRSEGWPIETTMLTDEKNPKVHFASYKLNQDKTKWPDAAV